MHTFSFSSIYCWKKSSSCFLSILYRTKDSVKSVSPSDYTILYQLCLMTLLVLDFPLFCLLIFFFSFFKFLC
ncbi:hypothetical protein Lalb_Chr07g0194671 [Lupinus albus]|uniref:Uncharacterized protein n=1 Tax=Lupinus albus TaxID=3870 RepID=A0A6A4QAB9_LUPAL|nr:hypothetical protein Lalb_Chr07g0194671 [Lupinus albus]